jgi:hypothetical protein
MNSCPAAQPRCTVGSRQDGHGLSICYFNTWARGLEPADAFLMGAAADVSSLVSNRSDVDLVARARLDCDWYAENARCLALINVPAFERVDAWVCGLDGVLEWVKPVASPNFQRWFVVMAHQPQKFGSVAGKVFSMFQQSGVRILYYAFDEASRAMPCFKNIAPYLDVLIHDESPLDPAGAAALRPDCLRIHRSWVANFVPFSVPFNEEPENKILFLGSQLGLTDHRKRQIEFLRKRFKDRFVPSTDHSVSIADRGSLNRYKVGLCPEGRKFTTPAMSATHTDRPFWSGCLGMVPVSENSQAGNRLDDLADAKLILRYPHGDLEELARCCERALETPNDERRRIYEHFNRHETIGTVVADAIANAPAR